KECDNVQLTVDDIADVIEAWTKIPVHTITEKETDRLLTLEDRLHKRVIGQNEAISSLSRAIRRNRLGFRKKKKPSSFIFVGPTGVGKTELVKALACELFGSEDAMIRIDMSEYME
ncbi:MAG TPA: chaperone ClpB, partial [Clostridiaceae bacterium]|nr:chaperone ClpB [Clostridiaceae bacterium]